MTGRAQLPPGAEERARLPAAAPAARTRALEIGALLLFYVALAALASRLNP